MAYTLRYEYREGYMFVHMKGPESYDNALNFWKELRREGDLRKYSRVGSVVYYTGVLSRVMD